MDISDIARMLADRIDSLVVDILPAAVKEGPEWRVGSCAGEAGRSMAIHCHGTKSGTWCDFSNQEYKGDALDLVAFVLFSGDKAKAVAWAKSWLGVDNLDPARLRQERMKVQRRKAQADRENAEKAEKKRKASHAIWLNASKALCGTPADLYLLGRGIGLHDLPRVPGSLRFADSLKYWDHKARQESFWPGMVAAITNHEGRFIACHRTFLKDHGGGLVMKAPVADAKLTLGSYRGGTIALSRGASGKKLREAPEGDTIILCEGIEDGLTIALCQPDKRVHAAISVGNFQNVRLPQAVKHVVLAVDNDPADSSAAKAVQAAVDVLSGQGRDVSIARPPEGYKDFNEMYQALSRGEGGTREQG